MNCNQGLTKLFVVLTFAIVINFTAPFEIFNLTQFGIASDLLARLFQLLFILFIISPPLIVVLLFLIWQELKQRNKMK